MVTKSPRRRSSAASDLAAQVSPFVVAGVFIWDFHRENAYQIAWTAQSEAGSRGKFAFFEAAAALQFESRLSC